METIYLTLSSLLLVIIALTTADPDLYGRDEGHLSVKHGSYGNYGYGHLHKHSYRPKRKTGKFNSGTSKQVLLQSMVTDRLNLSVCLIIHFDGPLFAFVPCNTEELNLHIYAYGISLGYSLIARCAVIPPSADSEHFVQILELANFTQLHIHRYECLKKCCLNRFTLFFSVKCYQCAYSPGKTTYKEIHEPVSVRNPYNPYEKKVEYRVRKVGRVYHH